MEKRQPKINSTEFAMSTAAAFSMILMSILLISRIVTDHEAMDILSLITGAIGAFCYGKFIIKKQLVWLIISGVFFAGCIFFFMKYIM
ncbi:hypothetical protein JZO70_00115 [Enterococcus sp. 669A]|uniref:Uncharacterized protein n=1 Tax=Candidatus Enterococcus moelleringii TaxID=2815325 RepID=A0ABS3L6Z4_9ENTE|nr:hypothetical protein [Enterococcus sp. 669A]MBO1304546.1 hypothetical protein [Enterococcus sp. 669A]